MIDHDHADRLEPTSGDTRIVFGGQTESNRIGLAELNHDDSGEPFATVKVFFPVPENFREEYPDTDSGHAPGLSWEYLAPRDGEKGGAIFQCQHFTLEYALFLVAALGAAINASGLLSELMGKITVISEEDGALIDKPLFDSVAYVLMEPNPDVAVGHEHRPVAVVFDEQEANAWLHEEPANSMRGLGGARVVIEIPIGAPPSAFGDVEEGQ